MLAELSVLQILVLGTKLHPYKLYMLLSHFENTNLLDSTPFASDMHRTYANIKVMSILDFDDSTMLMRVPQSSFMSPLLLNLRSYIGCMTMRNLLVIVN